MANTADGPATAADDADPVVARYSVFLKPQLPANQKLLVLQYPNRVDKTASPASAAMGARTPIELRMKSSSGMVEVDVPLDYSNAYDRSKGMAWGAALASSTKAKAGGSHGLAGGFGVGGQQGNRGRLGGGGAGGGPRSTSVAENGGGGGYGQANWAEAVRQDRVLRLQTLGGMCPPSRTAEARWMIGVFDGGNLHLTPVNSLVHLRPQLHHIDAETEVDRMKHRDGGGPGGGGGGAGGGADGAGGSGAGGRGGAGASAARAIHMTIKSAGADGDEMVTETMADRLRAVQTESWKRLQYVGDDDEHSWDVYDQTLFLRANAASAAAAAAAKEHEDEEAKAKGKAVVAEGGGDASAAGTDKDGQPLAEKVSSLRTGWRENEMLQAISGLPTPAEDLAAGKTPQEAATKTGGKGTKKPAKGKGKEKEAVPAPVAIKEERPTSPTAQRRTRPGRPRASSGGGAAEAVPPPPPTTSTRGRGGRPRGGGRAARGSTTAMDID